MKKFFCVLLKPFADPDVWIILGLFSLSQALLYAICVYLNGPVLSIIMFLWFILFELLPLEFTYLAFKSCIKKKIQLFD